MRRNRIFAMVLTAALLVQSFGTSAYAAGADVVPGATVIETVGEEETGSLEEAEEQTTIEESSEEESSAEELPILESEETTDEMSEAETVVETATDEMIETESVLTTEEITVEVTAEEATVVEVTEAVTEEETVTEEIAVDVRTETEAVEIAGLSQLKEVFGVEESVSGNTVTVILTSDIRLTGALEIDENITILAQGNRKIMRASTVDNIHMFHVMPEGVLTLGKEGGMGEGNTLTLDGEADLYHSDNFLPNVCNNGVMIKNATTIYNETGGTVNAYAGISLINSGLHLDSSKAESRNSLASAVTNFGRMYLKDVLIAGNGPTDILTSEYEGDYSGQLSTILNRGLEASMTLDSCLIEDNYCASGGGYQVNGVITNIGGEMYWKDSIFTVAEDEPDVADYRTTYTASIMNAGTLTVDGGDIEAMSLGVLNLNSIAHADYNLLTDEIVFYLKDGTLRTREFCDSIVKNHGRFEMSGGLITGRNGGLGYNIVYNYGDCELEPSEYSGVFVLEGGTIDAKGMSSTAVLNRSEMYMTGGIITGARIGLDHDFFYAEDIPQVFKTTVSGGTIKGCSLGVEINGGEFILDGGEITQNQEAVYMPGSSQRAVFTMNGGKITNNGRYRDAYSAVRLSGYDERLTDYHIFNFNGGLISGNMGQEGCGVYIDGERTIWNVAGGQITDNYATDEWNFNDENYAPIKDGAVYVAEETEVNIKDGLKYSEIIFNNHYGIEPTTPKVTGMLQELTLQLDSKASLKASSSVAGYEIAYSGYDADIIDVELDGTVTAKAIGKTTVTAKVGENSKTCTVYVRDIHADVEDLTLTRGESQSITLKETRVTSEEGGMEAAVTDTVSWSVENDLVADVSGSGSSVTVKGQGAGITYIIASVGSNANNRQNRIEVKIPVKVLVPLKNASLSRSK